MALQNHALFQVATKTLLFDGDKVLALVTPDGYIDFPGGRVDETEVELDWQEALRREVAEELGPAVRIAIGKTLFVAKRSYHHDGQTHRIAAIYFASELLGGNIQLSDEHGSYQWMTPQELLATDHQFVSDDEKRQLQTYFAASG
jgi:8-oxo-dGTP pyrophosphatase MutT (NUDIX family)